MRHLAMAAVTAALLLAGCSITPAVDVGAGTPSATSTSARTSAAPAKPPVGSVSQRNALRKAQSYLEFKGFSRKGLIHQLSSDAGDGFSKADATWAVDHLVGVNWNEQAVRAGRAYLDMTSFSRAGLIRQLSSDAGDGFTTAQATYAATKLGL